MAAVAADLTAIYEISRQITEHKQAFGDSTPSMTGVAR